MYKYIDFLISDKILAFVEVCRVLSPVYEETDVQKNGGVGYEGK